MIKTLMRGEETQAHWIPTVTASSAYAFSYKNGVVVACDSGAMQGGTARYRGVNRIYRLNGLCLVAFSGDWADFQFVQSLLEIRQMEMQFADPDLKLTPKMVHAYLTQYFYTCRTKFNPLWDTIIVAGVEPQRWMEREDVIYTTASDGKKYRPFIGVVMQRGASYEADSASTGSGSFLVNQMFETEWRKVDGQHTKSQALEVVKKALQVAYSRDCEAAHRYNTAIAEVEEGGVPSVFVNPESVLANNWDIAEGGGQFF